MSIKKRLSLTIILLSLIPLILVSFLIYNYTSKTAINESKNNILEITKADSATLTTIIDGQKKEVSLSVEKPSVIDTLNSRLVNRNDSFFYLSQVTNLDNELKERKVNFSEIQQSFVVDLNGNIIASSDESAVKLNVSDREYFKEAIKGNMSVSSTLRSKIDEKLVVAIAAPVKDADGNIVGVYANGIYTDYFKKFIASIKNGETGYAYIMDSNGLLVAHPDAKKVGTKSQNIKLINIFKNTKAHKNTYSALDTYTYDNVNKFMGYSIIPDLKWALVVTKNVDEINAPAAVELKIIISIAGFIFIISVFISILASKSITKPIEILIKVMNKAEKGDFSSLCNYKSKDELGLLAGNYNSMIKRLSNSYEELSAVYEELSATEEELRTQYDELIKNKEALELSEVRYEQVLDGINDALWEFDVKANKFFVSDKWYDIIGYKIEDNDIVKLIDKAIFPKCKEKLYKDIEKHMKLETPWFETEVKITTGSGKIKWILNRGRVIKDDNGEPLKYIGIISDVTIKKRSELKVKQLAYFDTLTGLPNRDNFINQLDEEVKNYKKYDRTGAVLFLDLDDFKRVNDSLGHDEGDKLLRAIGAKFFDIINGKNTVCRFGGDEFLVLIRDISGKDEVIDLVNNLINIFNSGFELNNKQVFITCSIGICIFPRDGKDNNVILKNADTAMYKAKETGKNRYEFYDGEMSKGLDRYIQIEKALRNAVGNGELYLCYQPQVEISTGKIIGTEALIRMKNEELGSVSPGEFIPVAEKSGLIIPIGEWVMKTAFKQNMEWIKKGYGKKRISVNVSSVQIKQTNFLETVKRCIRDINIPPELVEIEITESVLMESLEENVDILRQLRSLGVRTSLDDFGTGYSSLNYLRMIPIDILKIDKSFIDDICFNARQESIVDGIVNIAHNLGIEVVVEGVETIDQLHILYRKRCNIIQGYVFSKPMVAEEIDNIIKEKTIIL
ncbi:EAL domain-containing protein [Clostridium arbusti]|uniref:EAL domain-containing protein n=1 Tax=Clostridium arbusti TaxID=1137848 RepID=UPI0002882A4E|nr:EAL domain-containing protein [Clostridium arbusti]